MATCQFSFGYVSNQVGDDLLPAFAPVSNEVKTTSASNQQTTQTAPSAGVGICCRVATTGNVYVSFGTSPDATSDATRVLIPSGQVDVFPVAAGVKAAVVDA